MAIGFSKMEVTGDSEKQSFEGEVEVTVERFGKE